ncbi:MAG: glycogen/starch synthase [bacterium]
MKLAHLAEHVAPFGRESAAAIALSELPLAQRGMGHDVFVVATAPNPSTAAFESSSRFARRLDPLTVSDADGELTVELLEGTLQGSGIRLYLLALPEGVDRRTSLGRAALALLRSLPDRPDVIHLHDATGANVDRLREELDGLAVVQSVYDPRVTETSLIDAVRDADCVLTPCSGFSSTADSDGDSALGELLRELAPNVVAHGIDVQRWDPQRDKHLEQAYAPDAPGGKHACRLALQRQLELPPREDLPLVTVWSRGGPDSGLELLGSLAEDLAQLELQLVILRPAGVDSEDPVLTAFANHPKARVVQETGEATLRRVLGGCDAVVLPDRVAPLGRRARIALRYGLVPVARRVHAHRDLLVEYDALSNTGGAFLFDEPEQVELYAAMDRMRRTFHDRDAWQSLLRVNACLDFGWSRAMAQLDEIYRKALAK